MEYSLYLIWGRLQILGGSGPHVTSPGSASEDDRRCSLKSETLEKTVFVHGPCQYEVNRQSNWTDVCYEEPSARWEPEQDSEYAETETDDTDSTSETEF